MNRQEVQELAKQALTNKYEGVYNGADDPYLQSGKKNKRGFHGENKNGTQFTFGVVNTSGGALRLCLNPASMEVLGVISGADGSAATVHYHNKAAIVAAFGECEVADDGAIVAGLVLSTPKASYREFLNWTKLKATRIPEIVIQANDPQFFEGLIEIQPISPFKSHESVEIAMTESFKNTQFQDKKININTAEHGLQFDNENLVFIDIPDAADVKITYKIGMIENSALALERKAEAAFEIYE